MESLKTYTRQSYHQHTLVLAECNQSNGEHDRLPCAGIPGSPLHWAVLESLAEGRSETVDL